MSNRALKQLMRYLKARNTLVFVLEPHEMVETGLLELLDGLRTRALAKKLGLRFLDMAGGTNVGTADGGTNEEDR